MPPSGSWVNPRPTEGPFLAPYRYLDVCQTNGATKAKLAVPFGLSILRPMCKRNCSYHRLAASDVRVTSCPGDFDAK